MNKLTHDKRAQIISLLAEEMSVRFATRVTGVTTKPREITGVVATNEEWELSHGSPSN